MTAYYNEIEPYAAQWLRNLIAAGHIAPGEVDERSIEDVRPDELAGFAQCHFFAGIGVWSLALRSAGWSDEKPVWTGSCPCQPFSAAGKGAGFADERHLWPAWHHLISQCRPAIVLGEQVASKDGLGWLDLVSADMEGSGYAIGASDLCAAGVGAPHIRQRLWFVAQRLGDAIGARLEGYAGDGDGKAGRPVAGGPVAARSSDGGMADADGRDAGYGEEQRGWQHGLQSEGRGDVRQERAGPRAGIERMADADSRERERVANGEGRVSDRTETGRQQGNCEPERGRRVGGMADAESGISEDERNDYGQAGQHVRDVAGAGGGGVCRDHSEGGVATPAGDAGALGVHGGMGRPGPVNGFWRDADWLYCRDEKWRPAEPGTFPLAYGITNRVGRLRAYGNAINAKAAQAFIESVMECAP